MKKEILNRSVSTVAAAFIAASAISFPSAPEAPEKAVAADTILKYEFEDGETSGGKIHANGASDVKMGDFPDDTDLSGYSGKGFAYLDQKGTTLTIEADVPEDGLYEMTICYCEPSDPRKKVQYLNVNGVNQGELTCPYTNKFAETSGGVVNLKKGKNTIEIKAYWGYTFFDYLTLKPASEKLTELSPTRKLSNPNASDTTKRLYSYLCDVYGKHIIAGQQEYCGDHNYNLWNSPDVFIKDNEAEFEYIQEKTGKQPAIRGIDFLAYNTSSDWRDHAPERVIEWVNKYHGIATVSWHWNVPCEEGSKDIAFYVESANPKYTTFSISNALKEGTWENKVIMADIELIAGELQKLKEADVPVLWRPLHEAEGAWFWWGAEGAEPCKKLYRLLYEKLTNEYGLDNLIWIWTSSASPEAADWYPGDDVVDIIGCDKYNCADGLPNLSSIASTFYSLVQSTDGQKMVTMSENDSIPSLENLVNDKAAWLYFCPWYMTYLTSEQNNPVDNLIEIYNSDYCITLDELPDLKSYPIEGSGEESVIVTTVTSKPITTTSTSAASTTSAKTAETTTTTVSQTVDTISADYRKGDANCDGNVDMADAVLIMQSLANPDKYGVNGTDSHHITSQGQSNGDVDSGSKGLTSNDALEIQRYLLGLVKWDDIIAK
ncbi:glycosyl hydrolase [Ruminococcus sp.]|uniref:glycosyl hydrolase n=1 Tax=Ruminococcus sp. TaxID=41978 RepID=UPI001B4AE4C8|nr:glycosyl hydrolase [Ruminococcus sp.]MBP5430687.1 glycoside hydrolase [Ruminococcus sp.]